MSILLIYFEIPNLKSNVRLPGKLASFPVKVKQSGEQKSYSGLVITDGVASDRFLAFGNNTRGREGAKLRKALIAFFRNRLKGDTRLLVCFKAVHSTITNVVVDIRNASRVSLSQLTHTLKNQELSKVLEIVNPGVHRGRAA